MVGRTRLIRTTGSPLIGGRTRRRGSAWLWVVSVAVLAAAAFGLWWFFLR